ncbi:hypothetical protein [Sphingomonas sp. SUN039]|uniref:hypothetical protein n=1 Tax=Sphingomonas sp. SUN039 TaxID=2937787 RepID=UPI00216413A8|nr:hypothetical protein [Sphingomonas sp. SUN039]UVO53657.1 hypothetical protein M0209_05815 [Sphingomonas sp. SUN039]
MHQNVARIHRGGDAINQESQSMRNSLFAIWIGIGFDALKLGMDANSVIGLRLAKIATGGVAGTEEARLMVAEKMQAAAQLQTAFLTGRLGITPVAVAQTTLRYCSKMVVANQRRLRIG